MQVDEYHSSVNVTLPQVFFKHIGTKNQLPGLSIIGTYVQNGLIRILFWRMKILLSF